MLYPTARKNSSDGDVPILWPRSSHAAVTLEQLDTPCHCKQSMLLYGGKYHSVVFSDLWELRCKKHHDSGFEFEWILLKGDAKAVPVLSTPTAISAFNHSVVYISGSASVSPTALFIILFEIMGVFLFVH